MGNVTYRVFGQLPGAPHPFPAPDDSINSGPLRPAKRYLIFDYRPPLRFFHSLTQIEISVSYCISSGSNIFPALFVYELLGFSMLFKVCVECLAPLPSAQLFATFDEMGQPERSGFRVQGMGEGRSP